MSALVKPPRPGELLTVERARDLLAQAKKVDEVKKIRDQASAIRAYLRQQKASMAAQNDAAEIIIWSQRRLGQLTKAMKAATPKERGAEGKKGGRGKKNQAPESGARFGKAAALRAEGIAQQDASRWEKLAEIPEAKIKEHIAGVRARNERLTSSGSIAAVSHGADYESDEWYTPPEIIEAVRKVLGGIDVDPATTAHAQKNVQAETFYTPKEDGLRHEWNGRVFVNPPYSQPAVTDFVQGFIEEHEAGRMTSGIILLNASTDTQWFHDLAIRFPFCLTRGRLAFFQRNGNAIKGNRCGQVLFYAGDSTRQFRSVFSYFGTICEVVK